MSVHVSSWAWKQTVTDAAAKLVLLKLADNANDQGVCWPSQSTLAAECGLSLRTVNTKIADLEAAELLEIRRRGKTKTNVYTLQVIRKSDLSLESDVQTVAFLEEPSQEHVRGSNEPLTQEGEFQSTRPRDVLWDTLVDVLRTEPATKTERGRWNAALKELRDVSATPEELKTRAIAYRRRYPDMALTPTALAAHWGALRSSQKPRLVERQPEPEGPWVPPPKWPFSQEILKDMPA